ncbi:MAG TPA: hypothetical protein VIX20_13420 [Ktedonobacteraceae bacterium]
MMNSALGQEEVYFCAFYAPHSDLVAQFVGMGLPIIIDANIV